MMTFSDVYPAVRRNSLLTDDRLIALWDAAQALGDIPGDLAELGVYRGGVSRLLAKAFPTRTVHLFDTFAGLPSDGHSAKHDLHQPGEFASDLDAVKEYLSDCPNVVYHAGLFPSTATGERFALVHLDADLYASTLAGLEWFWPRLAVGGVLVLDDWKWQPCPGVEAAVGEYFGTLPLNERTDLRVTESVPHQLTIRKRLDHVSGAI